MREMTVASVTEQNDFSDFFGRKQLLRTVFDRYIVIDPIICSHDSFATLHINKNLRNAVDDAYKAPPQKRDL